MLRGKLQIYERKRKPFVLFRTNKINAPAVVRDRRLVVRVPIGSLYVCVWKRKYNCQSKRDKTKNERSERRNRKEKKIQKTKQIWMVEYSCFDKTDGPNEFEQNGAIYYVRTFKSFRGLRGFFVFQIIKVTIIIIIIIVGGCFLRILFCLVIFNISISSSSRICWLFLLREPRMIAIIEPRSKQVKVARIRQTPTSFTRKYGFAVGAGDFRIVWIAIFDS